MFEDVRRWAGKFRTSQRNIGMDYWLIPVELRNDGGPSGEAARTRAVLLGSESLRTPGASRRRYIDALQAADKHDITLLLTFARH